MVGIYCRISGNKEEGKDTSIETQEQLGIKFADGLRIPYKIYKDIGISGTSEEKRDDFPKFLKDIRKGVITHIYAINQARIERNYDTWRLFVGTVLNAGAKWYPNGSFFDLDNTSNRMMAGMMSLINEWHAQTTSDAVTISFARNAKLGKGHGMMAYGVMYDDDGIMQQHPEEIEEVKKMFKWSLEGMGAYSIAAKLNKDGVPTRYNKLGSHPASRKGKNQGKKNKKWWGSTVSGILKNEIYKGVYKFGAEIVDLPHLAILTPEEFEAVQDNFANNKRTKVGKRPTNKYLLHSLLFCEECGYKFFGKRRNKSRENTYKCSGKGAPIYACKHSRGFNIPRIETFILKHLFMTKDLQNHLNSIEEDDDILELLELELVQLKKKVASTEKMVTKGFNMLFESDDKDLESDKRIQDKYKADKQKLKQLKEKLEEVKKKKEDFEMGSHLYRINRTIDGFDLNAGFKAIKQATNNIIERIDVEYRPLEKNGRFIFKIRYKGFLGEHIEYAATQQLDRFACIKYFIKLDPVKWGETIAKYGAIHQKDETVLLPHADFNYAFDRFSSKNKMSVRVKRNELIHFE